MFEIITGPKFNLLGRGVKGGATAGAAVAAVVGGGSWSSRFPITNVYDGYPAIPGAATGTTTLATNFLTIDVWANLLTCGDGERTTPDGWTAYGSITTVTTDTTPTPYGGSRSLKVANSTGGAACYAYQRAEVQPGELLSLEWALYQAGSMVAKIAIRDNLGRYLTSGGAWQATTAYCVTNAVAGAWQNGFVQFVAPTVAEGGFAASSVEVQIHATGAIGNVSAEVSLIPRVDFVGLFGHSLPSNTAVLVSGYDVADAASPDSGSYTIAGRVGWFTTTTMQSTRYRLQFSWPAIQNWSGGAAVTTNASVSIGELVMGKRLAFLRNPDYPVSVEWTHPQARTVTPGGSSFALPRAGHPVRRITFPIDLRTDSRTQVRDAMMMSSRGGADRCVLIPTEADSDLCVLGRLRETATFAYTGVVTTSVELEVVEDALPTT